MLVYVLFFLLGFVSCFSFCYFYYWKQRQMLEIHDMLISKYHARKDFDRGVIVRLSNDLLFKSMKVKELEKEMDRLIAEKLKAWNIPEGL